MFLPIYFCNVDLTTAEKNQTKPSKPNYGSKTKPNQNGSFHLVYRSRPGISFLRSKKKMAEKRKPNRPTDRPKTKRNKNVWFGCCFYDAQ